MGRFEMSLDATTNGANVSAAADFASELWKPQPNKTEATIAKATNLTASNEDQQNAQKEDQVGKQNERIEHFQQTVEATETFRPATTATSVNAADYRGDTARGSIIATFPGSGGGQLCESTAFATGMPLPTRLGGVQVFFPSDTDGNLKPGQLSFVSPSQINAVIPPWAVPDNNGKLTAYIESQVDGKIVQVQTSMHVERTAPGIFSGDSSGNGVAAAQITNDGINYQASSSGPGFLPLEVNDDSVLVMYGTGLGARQGENLASEIRATVGGRRVEVVYAGLQGGGGLGNFAGEDQYNLKLDSSFAGMNGGQPVDVVIESRNPETGAWYASNVTKVKFK